VIVIVRSTDTPTLEFLARRDNGGLTLRVVTVDEPGTVVARNKGIEECSADVMATTDDDAVPCPEWVQRIHDHFAADPQLGGLGGRDRCFDGEKFDDRRKSPVGRRQWFGRFIGNHHLGYGPARPVDHFKGANMSFRRKAIGSLRFDKRLRGRGAVPLEDTSFSLAVRRAGWKLIYDPLVLVEHYEGERTEIRYYSQTIPVKDAEGFQNFAYNNVVALWDEFSPLRHVVCISWFFLVGTGVCPGLVQFLRYCPSMGIGNSWKRFYLAQSGMLAGYTTLIRSGAEPRQVTAMRPERAGEV
jgi:glycosyltransferase involved in cell wall biosynthesis